MKDNDWNPPRLIKEIGAPDGAAQVYKWMQGKGAPGVKYGARVAKILGIPIEEVRRKSVKEELPSVVSAISSITALKGRAHSSDVLQFQITTENEARIRLDLTLPVDQGIKMLQVILGAGMLAASGLTEE